VSSCITVPCGGNFTEEKGVLTFPGKLNSRSMCVYLISLPPRYIITLSIIGQVGYTDITVCLHCLFCYNIKNKKKDSRCNKQQNINSKNHF